MRLVYVVNSPGFFVSHRLVLAEAARDAGYDITVLTPDGEGIDRIRACGLHWEAIPLDRRGMNPIKDVKTLAALLRAYRRIKPDIVHHVTPKPTIYGTLAARLAGVPKVVNAISGMGFLFTGGRKARRWLGQLLYRTCFRHPNMRIIVQNTEDLGLIRSLRLTEERNIVLIPGSGVDLDLFKPAKKKPVDRRVVQTSRMLADKGVREFIEAAKIVRSRHKDVRFILVGDVDEGNPSSLDRTELLQAEAAGSIEWWGPRRDIADILAEATIYCLPSHREGLPKSLLEAAAAELPLVTTRTSGCAEVVEHERSGLLVDVGDAPALANAIERLMLDAALAQRVATAARKDAYERFSIGEIVKSQLRLYRT